MEDGRRLGEVGGGSMGEGGGWCEGEGWRERGDWCVKERGGVEVWRGRSEGVWRRLEGGRV